LNVGVTVFAEWKYAKDKELEDMIVSVAGDNL
jgi:hypothetical protein